MDECKRECQIKHAIKRCKERYSIEIIERDINAIVRLIEQGDGSFVSFTENYPNTIWEILYYGRVYYVVYSPETRTIVTFLPEDNSHILYMNDQKRKGVWKISRIRNVQISEEQIKIYNIWLCRKGVFIPDENNRLIETFELEFYNGEKHKLTIDTRTRQIANIQ